jgi:hypothetical protein
MRYARRIFIPEYGWKESWFSVVKIQLFGNAIVPRLSVIRPNEFRIDEAGEWLIAFRVKAVEVL